MNTPAKLVLGAIATGCIVVGVAAQIGTLRVPSSGSSTRSGGVEAQQVASSPASTAPPVSSPSPRPSPASAPPTSNGTGDEGGDGDNGD